MLKGDNVVIRPIERNDFELFYSWRQDKACLGNYMGMEMTYKESFLESFEKAVKDPKRFYAIIEDKDRKPIGLINYLEAIGTNTTLEIGILIAEQSARGKGIGTECTRLFVNYLFETKNIMRIQFITRIDNISAKAAGEKSGFIQEGVLKKYKFIDGDYRDYCLMAITRDDWER